MKKYIQICFIAVLALLVSSCAEERPLLDAPGFEKKLVEADGFNLTTYQKLSDKTSVIRFYIEGDGLAWVTSTQPSSDPTPRYPTAFYLAKQDPLPNVVYIARPCQYSKDSSPKCGMEYWTKKRFSMDVMQAINKVVNKIKPSPAQRIELVGFSGGAVVAVVLSARRSDVVALRTIAGNLDHDYVNKYHHVSPMNESLNAVDFAHNIKTIPQMHFISTKDKVIPPLVITKFVEMQESNCAHYYEYEHASHEEGWGLDWKRLLQLPVRCEGVVKQIDF